MRGTRPAAVVGLGQLGAVFATGLLRLGLSVVPVRRGEPLDPLAALDPSIVVVAVAEADLDGVLAGLPHALHDRLVLVQNDLAPADWTRHGIATPTVASVWFEKKKGRPITVIRPTVVAGPNAALVVRALEAAEVEAIERPLDALPFELARKSLYILGANLMGLVVGGTTGALTSTHGARTRALLVELLEVERSRLGPGLETDALVGAAMADFSADPAHVCVGRSAPARLTKALARADAKGLAVPTLRALDAEARARGAL